MDFDTLRRRYQRDPTPIRLGGLASNLNRIAWCMQQDPKAAPRILRESKYFTEWAAADVDVELQLQLAEVQRQLAHWDRALARGDDVSAAAEDAKRLSTRLLHLAGLIG